MIDLKSETVFGVRIDAVSLDQAIQIIQGWLNSPIKHYIVTPNIEFIMAAQKDSEFKQILNEADLALPDSARLNWAIDQTTEKNSLLRLIKWPLFIFPRLSIIKPFPITTGTDLMDMLADQSSKKGYTIGLLGGNKGTVDKLSKCLKNKYKDLRIEFIDDQIEVNKAGETVSWKHKHDLLNNKIDILFVALGHIKQEKWIKRNLEKYPVKLMIGVGGAFDYLSGNILRAPSIIRQLGFEWLFRLIIQPWRIKRFKDLVEFVLTILFKNYKD